VLSDILIKLVVLFLPTQLGLHFWPSFSRAVGIKIDYLSPTLYFLDLLILLLVILNLGSVYKFLKLNLGYLVVYTSFVVFNIFISISPPNTFFWWMRINLYLLTFLVFRLRNVTWKDVQSALALGTILVVFLEILQIIFQSSINGPFYLLGERAYSSSTPGIGRLDLLGREILRPPSTFSHPNSLAGYLVIVYYLFSKKTTSIWLRLIPFLGILLTFSKINIAALSLIIFNVNPSLVLISSYLFTLLQPLAQNIHLNYQSLNDRQFFLPYLERIPINNLLTGLGLGGFIPFLSKNIPGSFLTPEKLQPIHNVYYLLLSEVGAVGVLILNLTLLKQRIFKTITNPKVLGLVSIVLFVGAFDHSLWTLPQNKLIFLVALSLMI
jgi:hypothetical protein